MPLIQYSAVPQSSNEVKALGNFVHKQSWGEFYPYNAKALLHNSEYILAAYDTLNGKNRLVGCCALTRHHGCPDDHGDENRWLVCWVVAKKFRGQGIGTALYRRAFYYFKDGRGMLFVASVDSERALKTLASRASVIGQGHGEWQLVREGTNEDGTTMQVLRLDH